MPSKPSSGKAESVAPDTETTVPPSRRSAPSIGSHRRVFYNKTLLLFPGAQSLGPHLLIAQKLSGDSAYIHSPWGINFLLRPVSIPNTAVNNPLQEVSAREGGTDVHTFQTVRGSYSVLHSQSKLSGREIKRFAEYRNLLKICMLREFGKLLPLRTEQRIGRMSDNRRLPPNQVPLTLLRKLRRFMRILKVSFEFRPIR